MKVVLFKEAYSLTFTRELMYLLVEKGFPYLTKQPYNVKHKKDFFDKNGNPFNKYKDVYFSKDHSNTWCLKGNIEYFFFDYFKMDGDFQKKLVELRTQPIFVDCVYNYEKYTGKKLKDITTIDIPNGIDFYIYMPDYPSDEYIVEKSRRWNYEGKQF